MPRYTQIKRERERERQKKYTKKMKYQRTMFGPLSNNNLDLSSSPARPRHKSFGTNSSAWTDVSTHG